MRIAFFTRAGFEQNELFVYMYAHVAARFEDVRIVAVHDAPAGFWLRLRRQARRAWVKRKFLGLPGMIEAASSLPIKRHFTSGDARAVVLGLARLPRPPVKPDPASAVAVRSVNGHSAIRVLQAIEPDIIIQAGAGILRTPVLATAKLGVLNLHHGMAPAIRGMDSIYWGLWERRPDWIGATVHFVDEGIDTGAVLAHAPVAARAGEDFPVLFVKATEQGVAALAQVMERLECGERWQLKTVPVEGGVYRSSISGWRLLCLRLRRRAKVE